MEQIQNKGQEAAQGNQADNSSRQFNKTSSPYSSPAGRKPSIKAKSASGKPIQTITAKNSVVPTRAKNITRNVYQLTKKPEPEKRDLYEDFDSLEKLHQEQSVLDRGEEMLLNSINADSGKARTLHKLKKQQKKYDKKIKKKEKRIKKLSDKYVKGADNLRKKAKKHLERLEKRAKESGFSNSEEDIAALRWALWCLKAMQKKKQQLYDKSAPTQAKISKIIADVDTYKKEYNNINKQINQLKQEQLTKEQEKLTAQDNNSAFDPEYFRLRDQYFGDGLKEQANADIQKGVFKRTLKGNTTDKGLDENKLATNADDEYKRTLLLTNNRMYNSIHGDEQKVEGSDKTLRKGGLNEMITSYKVFLDKHAHLLESGEVEAYKKNYQAFDKERGKDQQIAREKEDKKAPPKISVQEVAALLLKSYTAPIGFQKELERLITTGKAQYTNDFVTNNTTLEQGERTTEGVEAHPLDASKMQAMINYVMATGMKEEDKMYLTVLMMKYSQKDPEMLKDVFGVQKRNAEDKTNREDLTKIDANHYINKVKIKYEPGGKGRSMERKKEKGNEMKTLLNKYDWKQNDPQKKDRRSAGEMVGNWFRLGNHQATNEAHEAFSDEFLTPHIINPARKPSRVVKSQSEIQKDREKEQTTPSTTPDYDQFTAKASNIGVEYITNSIQKEIADAGDYNRAYQTQQKILTDIAAYKKANGVDKVPEADLRNIRANAYWEYYQEVYGSNDVLAEKHFDQVFTNKNDFLTAIDEQEILTPFKSVSADYFQGEKKGNQLKAPIDAQKVFFDDLKKHLGDIVKLEQVQKLGDAAYNKYLKSIVDKIKIPAGVTAGVGVLFQIINELQAGNLQVLSLLQNYDGFKKSFDLTKPGQSRFEKQSIGLGIGFKNESLFNQFPMNMGVRGTNEQYPLLGNQTLNKNLPYVSPVFKTDFSSQKLDWEGKQKSFFSTELNAGYLGILGNSSGSDSQLLKFANNADVFGMLSKPKTDDLAKSPENTIHNLRFGTAFNFQLGDKSKDGSHLGLKASGGYNQMFVGTPNNLHFADFKLSGFYQNRGLGGGILSTSASYTGRELIGDQNNATFNSLSTDPMYTGGPQSMHTFEGKFDYTRNQFIFPNLDVGISAQINHTLGSQLAPALKIGLNLSYYTKQADIKLKLQMYPTQGGYNASLFLNIH